MKLSNPIILGVIINKEISAKTTNVLIILTKRNNHKQGQAQTSKRRSESGTFTRPVLRHLQHLSLLPLPPSGVVFVTLEEDHQVELLVEPSPGSTSPREPHRVFSAALLSLSEGVCGMYVVGREGEERGEAGSGLEQGRKNLSLFP